MGEPRLTADQLQLLQLLSNALGAGDLSFEDLWERVGKPLDRCHANGRHYFVKKLRRLQAAGTLVRAKGGRGGARRMRLGPLADLLRDQGKLA
jgi:hypothetical protein